MLVRSVSKPSQEDVVRQAAICNISEFAAEVVEEFQSGMDTAHAVPSLIYRGYHNILTVSLLSLNNIS